MKRLFFIIVFVFISTRLFSIDYITSPLVSGIYEDVVISNNTAYLATQWCVMILDVTDKTNPELVNIVPFNMAYYLSIQDNLLFVSTLVSSFGTYDNKTSIYDISNLHEPILISEIDESAQRFVVRDTLLFMQTQEFVGDELTYKLKIYNINNVFSPVQIAVIDSVKSFDFHNNYLYTANTIYNESEIHLRIYEVEDILNISLLNELSLPLSYASNNDPYLLIDGNIIYIAEWNSYFILNIINPLSPAILSYTESLGLMDWNNKFVKYHTYLYLNGGKIINVSNPANPEIAGNYDPPWPPGNVITSVYVFDEYLYVTNWEYGFYIMDLTNPTQPLQTYWYENTDFYEGIDIKDDYAYISSMRGVTILDISLPEESDVIGSYPYINWSSDICTDGVLAYVACGYGLVILNVSNPANMYPVGDYQGCLTRLAKKENLIFAVDNIWGVLGVYDVTNPNNIQYLGGYSFADNPNALCVKDNLLFIADANFHTYQTNYNGGLRIIDISNPANLDLIATINPDTTRYYRSLAQKDNYVFMGSNEHGIYVFDVSNPAQPYQVNYIESNRSSFALEVQNNYLYNGVQIFDISDINNIILIDSCTSVCGPGVPWSIAVYGNYIFEASTYAVNLYYSDIVTDIDDEFNENITSKIYLYQNYPNPFNSSTTIHFGLRERNRVNLSIYNIRGELVAKLLEGILNPGTYTINWSSKTGVDPMNSSPLSNGVYLYKLQAGDGVIIKKMLLLR
ncbi:MAG: T9SS type A sorting domain-containing protein [Candidatus Celaenobacter antarcticus]|nr:T9SS type A sorting domain-containing protein [Candidatus Celaenobacter antarcticus]